MWLQNFSLAVVLALTVTKAVAEPPPRIEDFRSTLSRAELEDAHAARTRSLASEAYLWGLPAFLHFRQTTEIKHARRMMAPDEEPFGGWVLLRDLATPQDKNNVMPNVDTLYGASYLLLDKQGPAVVSVPAVKNRYYSVAFHDAYFNTFAVVGTRTTNGDAATVLILPPDWKAAVPQGFTNVVRAPTNSVAVFQRIFTRDEADVPAVRKIQNEIRLSSLARWQSGELGFAKVETPEFDAVVPIRETRDPFAFFEIVNRHTCSNRPASDYLALVTAFEQVGLGPCASLPSVDRLRAAIGYGAAEARLALDAAIATRAVRNGWIVPDKATGRASPDYLNRAVVQITQIASFSSDEAMYFVGRSDERGLPLHGQSTYTLTFASDELPPVDPRAFWSVTMYDAATNLLVQNPIQRYILRPTTPGLEKSPDGSLTLYFSNELPGAAPRGNWLPAPVGEFIVVLRTYLPSEAIQTGSWFPPGIKLMR